MLSQRERAERASLAALTRHHGPESPEVIERRRAYKTDRLAEHVAAVIASAPPLTTEQRARIASLLGGTA